MEDSNIEKNYREVRESAKKFYQKIHRVWCPALRTFIYFNETGFHHLIQKGRKFRTKSEQKRRFALLVHAADILANPRVRISRGKRGKNLSIHYWAFEEHKQNDHITLIVRQVGNGEKHFLSIYGKKQKTRHESLDL